VGVADEDLQQKLLWWVVALGREHPRGEVPEQVLMEQIERRLGRHAENYERYLAAAAALTRKGLVESNTMSDYAFLVATERGRRSVGD
jgi:hypothetical protein